MWRRYRSSLIDSHYEESFSLSTAVLKTQRLATNIEKALRKTCMTVSNMMCNRTNNRTNNRAKTHMKEIQKIVTINLGYYGGLNSQDIQN